MLLELLLIPCLFISFSGWGAWANMLLRNKTESFSLTVTLGLAFFSIWVGLLSFFTPLTFYVETVLLILSVIPFLFKKLRVYTFLFPKALLKSGWFWFFCIIVIFAGTFYPFRPDHFYYYEPTLRWLNRYGLVIGVANIDWLLGQMSVFHILQAGLDQTLDLFERINSFIAILFLIYIYERKAYWLLLVIPFYFLFIQAPSPDVAIVFLSLMVVNELCFYYRVDNYKTVLIISVFTFAIKPVAFWLPLWVFIAGLFLNKKELKDYRLYLIPALIVVLFLIKNAIVSSTLFYPVSFTKLNTYWLPDLRILELSDQKASMLTFNHLFTENEITGMTFFRELYYWLTISKLQTIINCAILVTILAFSVFSIIKKDRLYLLLGIIIVVKTALIFSFSGQYRFLLDGLYPLLFLMVSPIRIGRTKIQMAGLFLSFFFLVLISYPPLLKRAIPDFKLTAWMNGFKKETLLIPGRYVVENYAKETIGNLDFYISSTPYTFDTPPPAFSQKGLLFYRELGIFPQWKDSTYIRSGFYMKTLTTEEKEKLEGILETYFP